MNGTWIIEGGLWAIPSAEIEPQCTISGWSLHRVERAGHGPTVHAVGEIRKWNGAEGRVTSPIETLALAPSGTPATEPQIRLRTQSGRIYELIGQHVPPFGDGAYVFDAWCYSNKVQPTDITQQILAGQLRIEAGQIVEMNDANG